MPCHIEQTLDKTKHFQPGVPWMYRDSAGKIAVGPGIVLPDPITATRLPFQVGPRAATGDEIAARFARVSALPAGSPALFYRTHAGPELEPAVMDTLLRTVLVGLEEHLREHISGYDQLPSTAKMALLDMAHSLTPSTLLGEYRRLILAVETENWLQAAAAGFRHGSGAERNQWTASMFRACTTAEPRESPLPRLAYGIIGLAATLIGRVRNKPWQVARSRTVPSQAPASMIRKLP